MRKELERKPIYNKKILNTKIKSYSDEATDFHDRDVGSNYTCLAVILILFSKKMKTIICKCF